jgi:hypothetical protein
MYLENWCEEMGLEVEIYYASRKKTAVEKVSFYQHLGCWVEVKSNNEIIYSVWHKHPRSDDEYINEIKSILRDRKIKEILS